MIKTHYGVKIYVTLSKESHIMAISMLAPDAKHMHVDATDDKTCLPFLSRLLLAWLASLQPI